MRRPLALLLVTALLPLVVLGAILGTVALRSQQAAVERQARDQAAFLAVLIGRELTAAQRSVQMLAQSPSFDGPLDEARFVVLGLRVLDHETLWSLISVSDAQGNRLLDVPRAIGGVGGGKVIDVDSHRATIESGQPTVGHVLVGPLGRVAFAVRAPVVRAGTVTHVVSAIVTPPALRQLLATSGLPQGWTSEIIDGSGNVVVRSSESASIVGRKASDGALRARSRGPTLYPDEMPDGTDMVATWRTIPGTDWTVHVAMPERDYRAPLARSTGVMVIGAAASALLAVLLVSLLLRELRQARRRDAATVEGQRLEALGRMTGGVAHDFNNLLTPIIAGLDLLQRRLADDPRSARLIETSLVSAERARTLVGRLLAFGRRQTLEPRDVDLAALLAGLGDLLARSVGPDIRLKLSTPPDLPSARVDPGQLELAVLNLAVNARDAMPDGGDLTIAADAPAPGEAPAELAPGPYVRLAVADTGTGMDEATLHQAVEPFFTTKPAGKGTGLGLSMAHGLAAQSGGALRMTSELGAGTRVELWLPAGEAVSPAAAEGEAPADGRTGRLLLVDDDDLVRVSTAAMLRDHGHDVVEARSPTEAMQLLCAGEPFDALVSDYAMPGRSGADLIRDARGIRPELPVILVTGFANAASDVPAGIPRLAKPYRRTELLNRIAELLPPESAGDAVAG